VDRWQQIESLFQEALRRDPAERDAWLQEACHGDTELHREVASLLANHEEAGKCESWAAAAAAQLIDAPGSAAGQMSLSAGTKLGPYEILSPLGAGGMGEVYRARDTKLGRDVALKVLPESMAGDAERRARFHHEAQILAALNHPNIAAIYVLSAKTPFARQFAATQHRVTCKTRRSCQAAFSER
jgi:hypothetical protein